MRAVLFRLVAELACVVGILCAAFLAYAGKPWWVWGAFYVFALLNIVTEYKREKTVDIKGPEKL